MVKSIDLLSPPRSKKTTLYWFKRPGLYASIVIWFISLSSGREITVMYAR
jgi:hypothetical protein